MNTSTLLRQAMGTLEAAYTKAIAEHGRDSLEAQLLSDAVTWMRDWMRHYTAARWASGDAPDRRGGMAPFMTPVSNDRFQHSPEIFIAPHPVYTQAHTC